jgi:hypothetical protein
MRIRIQLPKLNADPCGCGSATLLSVYCSTLHFTIPYSRGPSSRRSTRLCSIRSNWTPPPPHSQASVLTPLFGSGGGTHSRAGEGGGPNSDEGTDTGLWCMVLQVSMYFVGPSTGAECFCPVKWDFKFLRAVREPEGVGTNSTTSPPSRLHRHPPTALSPPPLQLKAVPPALSAVHQVPSLVLLLYLFLIQCFRLLFFLPFPSSFHSLRSILSSFFLLF